MFYIVTDRNDADRTSPIIEVFTSREAAETFAGEWSADYGTCEIEEAARIDNIADMNDLFLEIDARFNGRTGNMGMVTNEELAYAIAADNYTYDELKARYADGGMESIYVFA